MNPALLPTATDAPRYFTDKSGSFWKCVPGTRPLFRACKSCPWQPSTFPTSEGFVARYAEGLHETTAEVAEP